MTNKIEFENHYSARVIIIFFPNGYQIQNEEDINNLKKCWSKNLSSWHSPYTCLFDLRNFKISTDMENSFDKLIQFFSNFFMRKIIGFYDENSNKINTKFETVIGFENATSQTKLNRENTFKKDLNDIRSKIQIDNDFNAHVMEINFLDKTEFLTKNDVAILKSKLQNILMLWHTPYSVMINCNNCIFSEEAKKEFSTIEKFLKGFFCKTIIGYSPKENKDSYPFLTFRSRHLAAASLTHNGLESGEMANCSTRKINTSSPKKL